MKKVILTYKSPQEKFNLIIKEGVQRLIEAPWGWNFNGASSDTKEKIMKSGLSEPEKRKYYWITSDSVLKEVNGIGCKSDCPSCKGRCDFFEEEII